MKLSKGIFRKSLSVLLSTGMMLTGLPTFAVQTNTTNEGGIQQQFYVAVDGDDSAKGTLEEPFKTVQRARDEVRKVNDDMMGNIVVNIKEGSYYLDETIEFNEEDSGTNGYEIIYQSIDGVGKAHLIGGEKVDGESWKLCDDTDVAYDLDESLKDNVYKIQLNPEEYDFNTLYVNDDRAIMARTQNYEYDPNFPMAKTPYMWSAGGGAKELLYKNGDLSQQAIEGMLNAQKRGETIAQVYVWEGGHWEWFTSTIPVGKIDTAARKLEFVQVEGKPELNRPKYGIEGGARYFLQGNLAFLDVPGEYFYNQKTGILYYYPKAEDGDIREQNIVIPKVQNIIKVKGADKVKSIDEPNPEKQVHNITFKGLSVECTEFDEYYSSCWNSFDAKSPIGYFPPEALEEGVTNPSYCEMTERPQFQIGAILLKDTHNITIDSVRVKNSGHNGIAMFGDNSYNTVKNSYISNIGNNGIITDGGYPGVGKYNNHHTLTNLLIHDIGELVGQAAGITVQQSSYNTVSHVEVYNSPRRGMFLTGAWWKRHTQHNSACPSNCRLDVFDRMEDSYAFENRFEYNYIHDCEQEGGDDGAFFICTLYRQKENSGYKPNYINQMVIGDIAANPTMGDYKPSNINLDMGTAGLQITNFKSVNPQQLNIRMDNANADEYVFENFNGFHQKDTGYGTNTMWKTFDDSKMEYDKIGIVEGFPDEFRPQEQAEKQYEDLYFRDEFDNGLNEWWSMSGKTETFPVYFSDSNGMVGNSFRADSDWNKSPDGNQNGTNIKKPFGVELNKIVEIDFFDKKLGTIDGVIWNGQGNNINMDSFARGDDDLNIRGIGVDTNASWDYYTYEVGNIRKVSNVKRSAGWHTFKWDYTSGEDVKMYIDDKHIATVPYTYSFNTISIGDFSGKGQSYFDNVVIYGGDDAPPPCPLPPKPETGDETEGIEIPGRIEAEEGELPTTTQISNDDGGKVVGYLSQNDIFKYKVNVLEEGDFDLTYRVAVLRDAEIEMYVDGVKKATTKLPATGGWSSWKNINHSEKISLTPGEHEIELKMTQHAFNINWFSLVGEIESENVDVSEIKFKLDAEPLILDKGDSLRLPFEILPVNATNKGVTFESNNPEVITVENDGSVTAVGIGNAEITMKSIANESKMSNLSIEVRDSESYLISKQSNNCSASASSYAGQKWHPNKAIDGKMSKEDDKDNTGFEWCMGGPKDDPNPWFKLEWAAQQIVKEIWVYDRTNNDDIKELTVRINGDESTDIVMSGMSGDGKTPGKIILENERTDVETIEFIIDRDDCVSGGGYGTMGFAEVKVFSDTPEMIPVNTISFESGNADLFIGNKSALALPKVIPNSASDGSYTLDVTGDSVKCTENRVEAELINYTLSAEKLGQSVITATTRGGQKAELVINVVSKDSLGEAIIEAQSIYNNVPGKTKYHTAFKSAIDRALAVYSNNNATVESMIEAIANLDQAKTAFNLALELEATKAASEIAEGLTIENPEFNQSMIDIPTVPFGYKVKISNTTPQNIIYNNGAIAMPNTDTEVTVSLTVTRIYDNTTATKDIQISVQGASAKDVLDRVTLEPIKEGDKKLVLPGVPYGFDIKIEKTSDKNVIGLDGMIYYPVEDSDIEVTLKVTKLSTGESATKTYTVFVPGKAKKAEGKFEAEDCDEQKGMILSGDGKYLGNIDNGDWLRYDYLYFGDSPKIFKVIVNSGVDPQYTKGTYTFRLDSLDGEVVGKITMESTGGWGNIAPQEIVFEKPIQGTHSLYMVAGGRNTGIGNLDFIELVDVTQEFQVPVTGVALNKTNEILTVGETTILSETVMPVDATNKEVVWSSSNEKVATVENGKVTAHAIGEATITVTTIDGGYTATCTIRVEEVDTKPYVVITGDNEVKMGETVTVTIGLANLQSLSNKAYAEQITVKYDSEVFSLENVLAQEEIELVGKVIDNENGVATILTASPRGLVGAKKLLNITLRAKTVEKDKDTSVTVEGSLGMVEEGVSTIAGLDLTSHSIQVKQGNTEEIDKTSLEEAIQNAEELHNTSEEGTNPGQYPEGSKAKLMSAIETAKGVMNTATTQTEVDQAVTELNKAVQEFIDSKIPESVVSADINQDGKIDVADLALVAYHYAAKEGDANWDKAQVADVAKDGKIDIKDLAFVANEILEK